ncbi:hypothetical protein OFC42_33030, partial [Escherichia coli]|nr:hypothetical protein [Escherichia coli]
NQTEFGFSGVQTLLPRFNEPASSINQILEKPPQGGFSFTSTTRLLYLTSLWKQLFYFPLKSIAGSNSSSIDSIYFFTPK